MPVRFEAGGPGIPLTGRDSESGSTSDLQLCRCASHGTKTVSPEVTSLPARRRLSRGRPLTSQL